MTSVALAIEQIENKQKNAFIKAWSTLVKTQHDIVFSTIFLSDYKQLKISNQLNFYYEACAVGYKLALHRFYRITRSAVNGYEIAATNLLLT